VRNGLNLPVLVSAAILAVSAAPVAQEQTDVEALLARVGERIGAFYSRALNVLCTEISTVQPLDITNSPEGLARTVESELRVERDGGAGPGHVTIVRKVRKVNGRAPREEDSKDRAGCTDPSPRSMEPLTFLLPGARHEFEFKSAGETKERNRTLLMIDFASANRRSKAQLVEDEAGHDDCFAWSGYIASMGRLWVDAGTHDVLRVERRLRGPVEVAVPPVLQRRHRLDNWVNIVREETYIRYRDVAFKDPDEVLLLPESIISLTVVRGGLQSTRRSQTFTNYQRFVTGGRVIE
jgi:hypothetical protein